MVSSASISPESLSVGELHSAHSLDAAGELPLSIGDPLETVHSFTFLFPDKESKEQTGLDELPQLEATDYEGGELLQGFYGQEACLSLKGQGSSQ